MSEQKKVSNLRQAEPVYNKITQKTDVRRVKKVKHVVLWSILVLCICYTGYVISCNIWPSTVAITGRSMEQTILDGDRVLLSNDGYVPAQGDIVVVAENGTQMETAIIKRVIAVEGQTVDINFETGAVFVDGHLLDESAYTQNGSTTKNEGMLFPQTVPQGCVFLLGDNRIVSEDSRNPKVGMVEQRFILGKVTKIIYPLHRIRFFE